MKLPSHLIHLQEYFDNARRVLKGLPPTPNRSPESINAALRVLGILEGNEDTGVLDTLDQWQGKGVDLVDIVYYVAVANLDKEQIKLQRKKAKSVGSMKRAARKKAIEAEEKWRAKKISTDKAAKAIARPLLHDDQSITRRLASQTGTPPDKRGTLSRPFYNKPAIRLCSNLHRTLKRVTDISENEIFEVIGQALVMFGFIKTTSDEVDSDSLKRQLRRWRESSLLRALFYYLD